MKKLAITLLFITCCYLCFAFMGASFDFTTWKEDLRTVCGFGFLVILLFVIL